jgi:hypothetical protein
MAAHTRGSAQAARAGSLTILRPQALERLHQLPRGRGLLHAALTACNAQCAVRARGCGLALCSCSSCSRSAASTTLSASRPSAVRPSCRLLSDARMRSPRALRLPANRGREGNVGQPRTHPKWANYAGPPSAVQQQPLRRVLCVRFSVMKFAKSIGYDPNTSRARVVSATFEPTIPWLAPSRGRKSEWRSVPLCATCRSPAPMHPMA